MFYCVDECRLNYKTFILYTCRFIFCQCITQQGLWFDRQSSSVHKHINVLCLNVPSNLPLIFHEREESG